MKEKTNFILMVEEIKENIAYQFTDDWNKEFINWKDRANRKAGKKRTKDEIKIILRNKFKEISETFKLQCMNLNEDLFELLFEIINYCVENEDKDCLQKIYELIL